MTLLLDTLVIEALKFSPEFFVLLTSHQMPRGRPRKFITVRQGQKKLLVDH